MHHNPPRGDPGSGTYMFPRKKTFSVVYSHRYVQRFYSCAGAMFSLLDRISRFPLPLTFPFRFLSFPRPPALYSSYLPPIFSPPLLGAELRVEKPNRALCIVCGSHSMDREGRGRGFESAIAGEMVIPRFFWWGERMDNGGSICH